MKIPKKFKIDKKYFLEDIEILMEKRGVSKENVISITEDKHFTTLWYWGDK